MKDILYMVIIIKANFKIFLEGLVKDYVLKYGIKDNDDIKINKNKYKEKDGRKGKKCC